MTDQDIIKSIEELQKEVHRLNQSRFLRMYSSWWRYVLTNFIRGLFVGLGSVIGATLLVYMLISFLSQIDFVPIIGEYAVELINIINNGTKILR